MQRQRLNYLAGSWAELHGGVKGVIISGKQAAEMVHSQIKRSKERK